MEQEAGNSDVQSLIALLRSVLNLKDRRKDLIDQFQRIVWDAPEEFLQSWAGEVLGDLAYDLDFYEPDPKLRQEDVSFYGNDRLEELVAAALQKLTAVK